MMLAVAVAVAIVVVAIPACQMIGCSMDMSAGMMRISTVPGPHIGSACDGQWITSSGSQYGVPPSEFSLALVSLILALCAAFMLFEPRVRVSTLRVADANPPPPPLDSRGERFIV
jgi:hypothetical protein